MKNSVKKVLSLALAGAVAFTSVFAVSDAKSAKKAANVPTAKLTIQAAADKEVSATTEVAITAATTVATTATTAAATSGTAATTTSQASVSNGKLTCKYDAKLATSIASASAVYASASKIKVRVTAIKGAVAVTDAAVDVLDGTTAVAQVLVTIKAADSAKQTKTLKFTKKKLVVKIGKSKNAAYKIKAAANATEPEDVEVASSNEKLVTAEKVEGKNAVKCTVAKSAKPGACAKVTITSGKKTSTIKVYAQNPATKAVAKKKSVTVKKGAKAKVVVKVTAQNQKKNTTDTVKVTPSNKKVVKVAKTALKKNKLTITVKAKKAGSSKLKITIGKAKAKVTVRVK